MKFVEIANTIGNVENTFAQWLDGELAARGWSQSEAARRGEMSSQMINAIVNGQSAPGLDSCKGIARALRMPMEDVLRLAGILPPAPQSNQVRDRSRVVYEVNGDELVLQLWRSLSPDDQVRVRDMMERLAKVEPRIIGEATGD